MRPARACDEGMFGVARRLGDARTMVEADYWWLQHGFSAADGRSKVYSAFQAANLAHLIDAVPAFSAKIVDPASVLKYRHRIEFAGRVVAQPMAWHRPTVTAIIDGKPAAVWLDTGTAIPLVMDRTHAASLGATPLLGPLLAPRAGGGTPRVTKDFATALVAEFKFGGLVMHNVAATVVPDGTFRVGVLVGLPVLARFGRVDLDDTRIAMGSVVPHCASGTALKFVGAGRLGFSTTVNDQPAVAFVDTGDVNAVTIKPNLGSGFSGANDARSRERREAVSTHHGIRIRIGSWSIAEMDVPDAPRDDPRARHALPPGVDVNIGAPLLALADVRIDFSKPALCVSPKPTVEHGAVIVLGTPQEDSIAHSPLMVLSNFLDRILTTASSPAGGRAGHATSHAH